MEWSIYLIYCLGFLTITDVRHFVSNTPLRDDGFLSVNLGMLGQRSVGQLWTRSIDQVGLRGSGSDTMFVNMRSQCPSSYAREVPKTILILVWIGLPLENWCMCVCIVWIRYLELMIRIWSWIKPFVDGRMSEERGDKEPATLRLPSSFECKVRKTLVHACHWSKAMIQGLWVPKLDHKTHKPTSQSLGWGWLHSFSLSDGFIPWGFPHLGF